MGKFTTNTPRPDTAYGSFDLGVLTGIIPAALAANSEIFQFRWSDAQALCRINKITLSAAVTTTYFAAGVPVQIDLVKSTAWTAAGTGGTGVTMAATLKRRTGTMNSSLLVAGDCRIATTAALGAGTKTLEGNSLKAIVSGAPITSSLSGQIFPVGTVLFDRADNDYPLILANNEGLSIRSVAVPATGTWTAAVQIQWSEMAGY